MHQTPVDVAELIDDMLEDWLRISDARQMDFGVERRRSVVGGDPTLLRELVANLVDNALGTPRMVVVTLTCAPEKGRVRSALPIPGRVSRPTNANWVFERYRSPVARGAGSGLRAGDCTRDRAAHGGTIEIPRGGSGEGYLRRPSICLPTQNTFSKKMATGMPVAINLQRGRPEWARRGSRGQ